MIARSAPVADSGVADLPKLITPKRYGDARGWFSETFHEQRLRELGIECPFVQDNRSFSKLAGTVRGLHFQRPPAAQAKLISVLRGRILDVAVDLRRGSPTYGRYVSVELSAEDGYQLYVPVGFAHGFLTLDDDVEVMYKVSKYYAPDCDAGVRWDDPEIAIAWPLISATITLSDKDRHLPQLEDFVSPFSYSGHPLRPIREVGNGRRES